MATTITGSSSKNSYGFYAVVTETVPSDASSTNKSSVNVKVYIQNNGTRTSSSNWNYNLTVDGTTRVSLTSQSLKTNTVDYSGGTVQLMDWTGDIYHNTDGSKSLSVSAYISKSSYGTYDPGYCSLSGTVTLTTIPRYFTSTPALSLTSKTETTMVYKWATSETCSALTWNGGGTMSGFSSGTSGTITISGLSANTTYSHYGTFKRSDSGLTTNSATQSNATYNYPYASSMPNFTVGNSNKITIYNPLSRSVALYMLGADGSSKGGDTTTGTSISGYYNSEWCDFWYASIPNSNSGTYKVRLVCSALNRDTTVSGGTYSIDTSTALPTFNDFTYKDANEAVVNVTGNDQVLVDGLSTLQVNISGENVMTTQKYATPLRYGVSIAGSSALAQYSDDVTIELENITVDNDTSLTLTVSAYDSRTNSKSVSKDVTVYNYDKPVVYLTSARANEFEEETTLTIKGKYTRLTIDEEDKNTISAVQYRYKEASGSWSDWETVTFTASDGEFTCNDVILSLDNTKSFQFEVQVIDNLDSNTATTSVDVGIPIFLISSNKKACYINGQEILTYEIVDEW